jgi:hypothetical protein
MAANYRALLSSCLTAVGLALLSSSLLHAAPPARRALLVGCTQYPNSGSLTELYGPANDARLFAEVLKERFGFQDNEITILAAWPDETAARPTRVNILQAFERLARECKADSQVLILLAGHGSQIPIPAEQTNALDPRNPEPDGFDEVFLPADFAGAMSGEGRPILDDEIGEYLQKLKAQGANVWAVFDACHSGTMWRSANGQLPAENHRGVPLSAMGIPVKQIAAARQKATTADQAEQIESSSLALDRAEGQGSLVAFYAAQSFELAPEMPRPAEALPNRENYHGLLSHTIAQTLRRWQGPIAYQDLGQAIASAYRSERSGRGPTPFWEGDVQRQLLGAARLPRARFYLEKRGEQYRISAGSLHGLAAGAIVRVLDHAASTEKGQDAPAAGFLRVTKVSPTSSEIESIEYRDRKAIALDRIPLPGICELELIDHGDQRLKLAIESGDDPATNQVLREALVRLPSAVHDFVQIVPAPPEADWILRTDSQTVDVSTAIGNNVHRFTLEPKQEIAESDSSQLSPASLGADSPRDTIEPPVITRRMHSQQRAIYVASNASELTAQVHRDLLRIFAWENLWRTAHSTQSNRGGVRMDVQLLGQTASEMKPSEFRLRPGQRIAAKISNDSSENHWVCLLIADAAFGVQVWYSGSVRAKSELRPLTATVTADSVGPEGLILIALPFREQLQPADLGFLEQPKLGAQAATTRSVTRSVPNDFERLLGAVGGRRVTRDVRLRAMAKPSIQTWSWFTLPEEKAPGSRESYVPGNQ